MTKYSSVNLDYEFTVQFNKINKYEHGGSTV